MQLPADLRQAISPLLEGVSRTDLGARAARISELYRTGGASSHAIRDEMDALAYAVVRLPATYAALGHVFARLEERCAGFAPRSLLDLGSGPGTASWAAAEAWPELESVAQIDCNAALLRLGRRLSESAASPALRRAEQRTGNLADGLPFDRSVDLVAIGYTLAELGRPQQKRLLAHAWRICSGALAIVEPGTPAGYNRILQARDLLLAEGARVVAPCPHQQKCPLIAPDWCHFAQRLSRARDHRTLKGADLPYEDEKFSFLVVVREPLFRPAEKSRILAPPQTGKAGVALKLCTTDGQCESLSIGKRDREAFRRARKMEWGDEL